MSLLQAFLVKEQDHKYGQEIASDNHKCNSSNQLKKSLINSTIGVIICLLFSKLPAIQVGSCSTSFKKEAGYIILLTYSFTDMLEGSSHYTHAQYSLLPRHHHKTVSPGSNTKRLHLLCLCRAGRKPAS